jgi:hypothetical protein
MTSLPHPIDFQKCNKLPCFYDDSISTAATYKEFYAYGEFACAV